MTINMSGFIYKVAYGWSHAWRKPPEQTNLCGLFWRSVLATVLIWPFYGLCFVVGFLFAARPQVYYQEAWGRHTFNGALFTSYKRWPAIPLGDDRIPIYPGTVLILAAGLTGLGYIFWQWPADALVVLTFVGVILGLAALLIRFQAFEHLGHWLDTKAWAHKTADAFDETAELAIEFVKAKKQRVCPIITIKKR
jgi:hypothetical protein